jgi:hypothetical protein
MKPLKMFCVGAEATVIATLAASSYHIAFSGASGIDWLAGAPILTVVALEMLRLPIAFNMTKAKLGGLVMSTAMILGLSVITMEAASMAFENLIFQRTRPVVEAEAELKKVSITHDTLDEVKARQSQEISRLTADLDAARKHREEVAKDEVKFLPPPADQTKWIVMGKGKHAKRVPLNVAAPMQGKTLDANTATQAAHVAELKTATEAVTKAQDKLDEASKNPPDMRVSDEEVKQAKQKVADARSMNPMFRVAAAWQKVPVQELSSEEFEGVKHYAVIALAAATAFTTALAAVISSLPERGKEESKLARAIRAMVAARRKTIRRLKERVVTEFKDRIKLVYVPVDIATGKVLDPAFAAATPATPNLKVV